MRDKLKECPFCGSDKVQILYPTSAFGGRYEIKCSCGLWIRSTNNCDNKELLVDKWNTRNIPKHETVEGLRYELERTTSVIRQFLNSPSSHTTKGVLEECCKFNENLVANHHGKPEDQL